MASQLVAGHGAFIRSEHDLKPGLEKLDRQDP
jgi:hypothetical protein